jgi:hypothetical protein
MSGNLPNTDDVLLQVPDVRSLRSAAETDHPPRIQRIRRGTFPARQSTEPIAHGCCKA